jgi:hypothetical protein
MFPRDVEIFLKFSVGQTPEKMPERDAMHILDRDLKRWVEEQAALDASSQNSMLVRALRRSDSEQRAGTVG